MLLNCKYIFLHHFVSFTLFVGQRRKHNSNIIRSCHVIAIKPWNQEVKMAQTSSEKIYISYTLRILCSTIVVYRLPKQSLDSGPETPKPAEMLFRGYKRIWAPHVRTFDVHNGNIVYKLDGSESCNNCQDKNWNDLDTALQNVRLQLGLLFLQDDADNIHILKCYCGRSDLPNEPHKCIWYMYDRKK